MVEYGYKIAEPELISTSNHSLHDWVLKFCVLSSVAISFGTPADYGTSEASSCNHVEPISSFEKTDITNSDNLISKLNINAGIKERLISRLIQFKNVTIEVRLSDRNHSLRSERFVPRRPSYGGPAIRD